MLTLALTVLPALLTFTFASLSPASKEKPFSDDPCNAC